MSSTSISDLPLNTPFAAMRLHQYIKDNSAFIKSGVCQASAEIDEIVQSAGGMGKVGNLPFINDLSGDDEALAEGTPLTENKVTGGQDTYVIHRRGKAFSRYDLAAQVAGVDPLGEAIKTIGDYQLGQRQAMLFRTLNGVFADNAAKDNGDLILDITGETGDDAYLSKWTLLKAAQLLGDRKKYLTAVAMHSAVETQLSILSGDSQTYRPAADTPGALSSYCGKSIIMDDECGFDTDTGVAEVYLFARGAVAMNDAKFAEDAPQFEKYRSALDGKSGFVIRDAYIMHPRGFAWTGGTSAATPANATVEAATSWDRVWPKKDARVVKLVCKIPV